eukprot:2376757-Pyramimonas_sp.AAC.2
MALLGRVELPLLLRNLLEGLEELRLLEADAPGRLVKSLPAAHDGQIAAEVVHGRHDAARHCQAGVQDWQREKRARGVPTQ